MNGDVGYLGVGFSLILVAVAAGLVRSQHLGLERSILWAAGRALVQLLLVGYVLTLILSPGRSIWWSWAWLVLMVVYAADVARRRAPEVPGLMVLALPAFGAPRRSRSVCCSGWGCFPCSPAPWFPWAG